MIVEKTKTVLKVEALDALIKALKPLAEKFKALHKADQVISECGWTRGGKHKIWTRIGSEFWEVYEYKKPFESIADLIEMLEAKREQYYSNIDYRSLYTAGLTDFLRSNFGAKIEMSRDQFEVKKRDGLEALRLTFEFLNELKDCADADYSTATPEGL